MIYTIEFAPNAERQFSKLPQNIKIQLFKTIQSLSREPRPHNASYLTLKSKQTKFLRIRKGDYRIIYTIDDDILLVLIVSIGHRSDIYKKFFR